MIKLEPVMTEWQKAEQIRWKKHSPENLVKLLPKESKPKVSEIVKAWYLAGDDGKWGGFLHACSKAKKDDCIKTILWYCDYWDEDPEKFVRRLKEVYAYNIDLGSTDYSDAIEALERKLRGYNIIWDEGTSTTIVIYK